MRWRAAVAAILSIGFVAAGAHAHLNVRPRKVLGGECVAVFVEPWVAKCISVGDLPPHVDCQLPSSKPLRVVALGLWAFGSDVNRIAGGEGHWLRFKLLNRKRPSMTEWANRSVIPMIHIEGWRLPHIFHLEGAIWTANRIEAWRHTFFDAHRNISTQLADDGIGRGFGGVRRFVGNDSGVKQYAPLTEANKNQKQIENLNALVVRRALLAISLIFGGYFIGIRGIEKSNNERNVLCSALVGWLRVATGFLLLGVSGYRSTWGWPF